MRLALDKPYALGRTVVAAVARTDLGVGNRACFGGKWAVAILVWRDDSISAFAPDGRMLSGEDVEALCPGALAQFEALRASVKA